MDIRPILNFLSKLRGKPPIKVGILHSLSGHMAFSARAVANATLLAIDEINNKGGLLGGRKIKAIVVDGQSDGAQFKKLSEKLIREDKVSVVFGCWSSSNRKSIKPIFEKYNHLLIYPLQYEGLEESPNIIYTGATPNQQIIPGIKWCFEHLGKRFYLVGSDSIFSRAAHRIIKDQIRTLQGEIIGDDYIISGGTDVESIIQSIYDSQPNVIINTINGNSNIAFFKQLRIKGITPDKIPTMSFSIAENELVALKEFNMTGDYATWNYFQSIPSDVNQRFVQAYKKRFGKDSVTSDPIESGYLGVYIWAQAVSEAKTDDTTTVKETIKGLSYIAPEGVVLIDKNILHTWKTARIGKIRQDGQFNIVWQSPKPIQPNPYLDYRSKAQWQDFLDKLYADWDYNWSKKPNQF
jgi:urea transport system substrate-binding protein